jgi:hypothetical protein
MTLALKLEMDREGYGGDDQGFYQSTTPARKHMRHLPHVGLFRAGHP